jgi:hypothetical protein
MIGRNDKKLIASLTGDEAEAFLTLCRDSDNVGAQLFGPLGLGKNQGEG